MHLEEENRIWSGIRWSRYVCLRFRNWLRNLCCIHRGLWSCSLFAAIGLWLNWLVNFLGDWQSAAVPLLTVLAMFAVLWIPFDRYVDAMWTSEVEIQSRFWTSLVCKRDLLWKTGQQDPRTRRELVVNYASIGATSRSVHYLLWDVIESWVSGRITCRRHLILFISATVDMWHTVGP
jgi:hypothetical protein